MTHPNIRTKVNAHKYTILPCHAPSNTFSSLKHVKWHASLLGWPTDCEISKIMRSATDSAAALLPNIPRNEVST
jgi:hypothetical protein